MKKRDEWSAYAREERLPENREVMLSVHPVTHEQAVYAGSLLGKR